LMAWLIATEILRKADFVIFSMALFKFYFN